MNILAFDSSAAACSVALTGTDRIIEFFEIMPRQQATHILPLIETALSQANIPLKQLDAIAFANGPGSFTGIRLAASIAQGLALGANVPIVPISTLCAMAQGAYHDFQVEQVLVVINAHSGDVYCGAYQWQDDQMQPVMAEQRCQPNQVKAPFKGNYIGIGDGWSLYPELLPSIPNYSTYHPHAKWVARLAEAALAQGIGLTPEKISPSYLHQADAWKQ
jgi:tRNA threonylcarbamoyladenosine biosynthesis protein TsaB